MTSPAASTARPDIARTLRCTSRSIPAMPIAESSAPIVVGMRQTSSATSTGMLAGRRRVGRDRVQGQHDDHEDDRQAREQDVQRDLVGRLLAARALDEGDHAVDERLARLRGDAHDDAVGEHARAAGDGAAVAARLADDGRGLAGDGRLVDGRDAPDDVAVAGDQLAGGDDDDVAERQVGRGDLGRRGALGCGIRRARRRRRPGAPSCSCGSCAASPPAPCRGPRRPTRRGSRTAR